jgi:hypothetical protein
MKVAMTKVVALSALLWGVHVAAGYAQPYSIKDTETIHSLNRTMLRAHFPFEKAWRELTTEQRALFRSKYVNLSENDEPPFPEEGIGPISREVHKYQTAAMAEGLLILTVRIDETGTPQSVSAFETPDPKLAQAVAYSVMKIKYKPAYCLGRPCAMDFPFSFRFSLR